MTFSSSDCLSFAAEAQNGVIFDGWLYNRDWLLAELGLLSRATTASLVLHAYLRWGERALDKLKGIFSFCMWDDSAKALLAARDPAGVYPLFYARSGCDWLFSTSIDRLLQHPGVSKTINRTALATYLWGKYRDIEETFFLNVRRVPPGHVFKSRATDTNVSIYRYWNPVPADVIAWLQEDELEQFPEIMKQAVGRCLQLGRAGIYLSGGLDSGTIATLTAEYTREKLLPSPQAVSLVYSNPEANEERIQRGIAKRLGIPQTLISDEQDRETDGLFLASLKANATWPHPFVVGLSPLHLVLGQRAREKGCDLVLSGEGGDEWLAIHYGLGADFMRSLEFSRLCQLWKTTRMTSHDSWYGTTRRILVAGSRLLVQDGFDSLGGKIAPGAMQGRRRQFAQHNIPSWLAPDPEVREKIFARAEKAAARPKGTFYQRDIVNTILNQPLTVLYKEDNFESSRRTGVLMLEPFYDPDVVAFLVRMPPWLRSRGGRYKGLLRQILHQRFPELGYDRQQKPYATNFFADRVFRGSKRLWPDLKGARALANLGVVEQSSTSELIREILAKDNPYDAKRLWIILCAEIWTRSQLGADSNNASLGAPRGVRQVKHADETALLRHL
jgi:asparagine synthase (glutamine-hydrolysing)